MARLTSLKHLFVAAIGISGIVVACRATSPEAPPLAPAPGGTPGSPSPVPSGPTVPQDPTTPGPNFPTEDGGAPLPNPNPGPTEPGPISAREMPIPDLRAERYQLVDAGLRDAAVARDAMPADSMIYDARPPTDATLPPPSDAGRRKP
ncbi:MAG: hypothetical protein AB7T06_08070 [Kofleriaceae bacterium]